MAHLKYSNLIFNVVHDFRYVPEVNQRRSKRRMYGRKWRDQKDVEQEERAQLHQWMNTLDGKYVKRDVMSMMACHKT